MGNVGSSPTRHPAHSPGQRKIRFPGVTDPEPVSSWLLPGKKELTSPHLPQQARPPDCPGFAETSGVWTSGHLGEHAALWQVWTHTYFFISYSLSPSASRKPLFKINTEKMCYTVSYNTIQSSIKCQTLFKQSSWTDWQINKSEEIQRGGAATQPGVSPSCRQSGPTEGAAGGSSLSLSSFLLSYHNSVKVGYG